MHSNFFRQKNPSEQAQNSITTLERAITDYFNSEYYRLLQSRLTILAYKNDLNHLLNTLKVLLNTLTCKDNDTLNTILAKLEQFSKKKTNTVEIHHATCTLIMHCKQLDWYHDTTQSTKENTPDFLTVVNQTN